MAQLRREHNSLQGRHSEASSELEMSRLHCTQLRKAMERITQIAVERDKSDEPVEEVKETVTQSDEPVEEVETSRLGARQWAQWKIDIVHYYFNK